MREIVLDTETTGFDPESGDRIVEIGAIELVGHMPTGRTYHQYINPERSMPREAFEVHGIGPDLLEPPEEPKPGAVILRDKPVFKAVGQAFLDFIGDAKLVIHNAAFDMKFLNAELKWIGLPEIAWERAVDTLAIARRRFPGSPASLDALCRRFGIDNSSRTLHGALLDSEILADVYLELIGGRQPDFALQATPQQGGRSDASAGGGAWRAYKRPNPLPSRITEKEAAAHAAFVEALGDGALWKKGG
ncbi:DNA polymerase III subunit epsilon [Loktanella sp. IMCC34160]|uniref:DNA polymerase III subunit epsilon n=1 Tax=Loktanella sp. IMCC34160 TaxID=2510646 RepID=UPI00101BB2AA|nr:DNA polymerase III subunit epsilon [Loktanella sp. IMCC34160]RYG91321.1 DNA polymerase III subunit epsilon [Loktanella sp. IMCC34160]